MSIFVGSYEVFVDWIQFSKGGGAMRYLTPPRVIVIDVTFMVKNEYRASDPCFGTASQWGIGRTELRWTQAELCWNRAERRPEQGNE